MGHIWLVGMMGSGKTTVGVLVAQALRQPFIDTDAEIMKATGRTVFELFADSEAVFRSAESRAIGDIAGLDPAVVATGGGAILAEANVLVMKASGTIVLLDVDAETIAQRVQIDSDRPLLDSPEAIDRILKDRSDLYRDVSEHIVGTVGRSPGEVALEVAACVDT